MQATVLTGDRQAPWADWELPVTLVLDRLRSAYNVGNLFRIAEAVRAERIMACGYTAAPPHEKLAKTAMGCDEIVPCERFDSAADAIVSLKKQGYRVYGVDTVLEAKNYWDAPVEFPCAIVLGNEALGISREALALCDGFISLPALGRKNSINVGNCGAVVIFEFLRRYREQHPLLDEGGKSL